MTHPISQTWQEVLVVTEALSRMLHNIWILSRTHVRAGTSGIPGEAGRSNTFLKSTGSGRHFQAPSMPLQGLHVHRQFKGEFTNVNLSEGMVSLSPTNSTLFALSDSILCPKVHRPNYRLSIWSRTIIELGGILA